MTSTFYLIIGIIFLILPITTVMFGLVYLVANLIKTGFFDLSTIIVAILLVLTVCGGCCIDKWYQAKYGNQPENQVEAHHE